jgi:hypothetical protein
MYEPNKLHVLALRTADIDLIQDALEIFKDHIDESMEHSPEVDVGKHLGAVLALLERFYQIR